MGPGPLQPAATISEAVGLPTDDRFFSRLTAFCRMLRRHAPRLRLVSRGDLDQLEARHIADSLLLLECFPLHREAVLPRTVDIGSGGGLPGIPLAVALPGLPLVLLEATRKKADFLVEVVSALGLQKVSVRAGHSQGDNLRDLGRFRLALLRAVAPPGRVPAAAFRLLEPGGRAVSYLGRTLPDAPQLRTLRQECGSVEVLPSKLAGELGVSRSFLLLTPRGRGRRSPVDSGRADR